MTARAQQKRADRSRRNKPHRYIDPMACITRRLPLRDDQQIDIGIAYHASLQALLTGHGTEQTWSTLACALNTSLLLSEYGVCAPATQTIKLAQEALLRARERAGRTGKWALDGGRILVHASQGMSRPEYKAAKIVADTNNAYLPDFENLKRGGIIGSVEIIDCVDASDSPWFFGPHGLLLRDPQPLPFQPMKGKLGLFNPQPALVDGD